jgi:uncharacterized protein
MIVEFSLSNYRSFNEIQTLSFRATGLVSEDRTVDENNIVEVAGQRLLKTVGVYGANASGKSNLVKGLDFLKEMVKWSLSNEYLLVDNHMFYPNKSALVLGAENWGYYQITLLLNNKKYRYGFTLGKGVIESEWLFGPAKTNETFYFTRKQNEIKINEEYFSEAIETPFLSNLRDNTLFLTFCSSYNGEISSNIRDFIANKVKIDTGNYNDNQDTNKLIIGGKKEIVLNWLKDAAISFSDIKIKIGATKQRIAGTSFAIYGNNFHGESEFGEVLLTKDILDKSGKIASVMMDLEQDESQGTQKYYAFIGKLYEKFENGGLFLSDEIDSNFHPTLLRKIIGMFNNPAINKANAQLLFTSHDTNLMSPEIMRRDQFYFTEKSPTDATLLYSLADLKGIRNNADFAKQYLAGYYGALPILGNLLETQANPE